MCEAACTSARCFADEDEDGERGEESGECADREEPSVADGDDERCGEQGACDGAERIHRTFDPKRSAELMRRYRAGQQCVACGGLTAAGDPRQGACHRDEGPGLRQCEQAVTERGDRVAARSDRLAFDAGPVGDDAPDDFRCGEGSVGDPLNDAKRGGLRADRAQKPRQSSRGHLMSGVGQQTAEADAQHAAVPQHMQIGRYLVSCSLTPHTDSVSRPLLVAVTLRRDAITAALACRGTLPVDRCV